MEEKTKSPVLNWSSVALLGALAANLFWLHEPLKTSRPDEPSVQPGQTIGDQTVEARLWQDPFEAIRRSTPAWSTPGESLSHLARQFEGGGGDGETRIVGVMVPGASYAEMAEWRRRTRIAVLAGLARSGFTPGDREHLGQALLPWPRSAQLIFTNRTLGATLQAAQTNNTGLRLTVPYEWFSRPRPASGSPAQAGPGRVLVLWLEEELFEDRPLGRLGSLMYTLEVQHRIPTHRWTVIGPYASGTLNAALNEALDLQTAGPNRTDLLLGAATPAAIAAGWHRLEFLSPFATAPDEVLGRPTATGQRETAAAILGRLGIGFRRTISSDREVCDLLVDELGLRGIDPARDTIALVSEWDTLYGRLLPAVFTEAVRVHTGGKTTPTNILQASYLRGLDGKLAGPDSKTAGDRASSAKGRVAELGTLERPEGNSQLDYVPRLAAQLHRLQASAGNGGRIRAVGVLGSDVFDKLLILQALRSQFPDAIFFTTDLNARLLHSGELDWTRNLVVASGFDLELGRALQDAVPPFRDSYQTAAFLAVQVGLGQVSTGVLAQLQPRIYEIGYTGARDLSRDTNNVLHPAWRSTIPLPWPWLRALLFLGITGGLLYLTAFFAPPFRRWLWTLVGRFHEPAPADAADEEKSPYLSPLLAAASRGANTALAWALTLVPLMLVALIVWDDRRANGEVFAWFDGISAWPSQLVRLVMLYLAAYLFFHRVRQELVLNKRELHARFLLPFRVPRAGVLGSRTSARASRWWPSRENLQRWRRFWARCGIVNWWVKLDPGTDGAEPTVSVPRLWLGYNRRGFLGHRIKRVLPPTLVYLLVGITVMILLGMPVRPVRGAWCSVTDVILLVGCVLTQIFLTFFVVDATQLSVRMIRQLATGASRYGSATLARHEQRLRINRVYLNEWLDIQIIAARTAAVSRLIFYPFITLGLMIAARNSFFDRWSWPAGLLIVMGCNLVIAVYAVVQLQRAAERAREDSLGSLRRKLLQVIGGNQVNLPPGPGAPGTVNLAEQLRSLIRDIETCSEGAFAPLSRQPVIQALAVPTGGTGLLALIDFLVRF